MPESLEMNTRSNPLVSIVTPVYNNEEYLEECVESVLGQTYTSWDYTIIDNCSSDRTSEIARRYAARHSRIRVHRNPRVLPVMANHNVALRQISSASKYCKVVFGDDWIFPECLERMVAVAEEYPSVGIVGAFVLEGAAVTCTGLPCPGSRVPGREVCRAHLIDDVFLFGSANSVLYRADLVRSHDPFYDEANHHSDMEICFELLKGCDFGFVHQVLTFTRVRPESLNARSLSLQSHYAGMLRSFLKHGHDYLDPEEFQARYDRYLSDYYGVLGKSVLMGRDRKFWDYHRMQLDDIGLGFSRTRLVRAALAQACAAALNPRDAIAKILKRARRRVVGAQRPTDRQLMG
jgi:glycosyltransferase involved in cell wall biosynthesis